MPLTALFGEFAMPVPAISASIAHAWEVFSQSAATALVTSIWQGALVAFALAICLRLAPRISAAHRFMVWAAGFISVAALPFLPPLARLSDASRSSAELNGSVTAAVQSWIQLDMRWGLAIAVLWVAASILQAAWLVVDSIRLRQVWKAAAPIEVDSRIALLMANAGKIWGRRPVETCTSTILQRPSVIGFFAPRILIPDWLLKKLTPAELEQIVLHETEHLRRRDDWTNLVQILVLIVFPLNPALRWIDNRLSREREMACDEGVVNVTRAPRAYAACLASIAERGLERRPEALSLGAWQKRANLVQRVHQILARKRALSASATWALMGAMGCGLVFGSVEMAQSPELVSFVPTHRAEFAQSIAADRNRDVDVEILPTAYRQASPKKGDAHGFYAMNVIAMVPEPRHVKAANVSKHTAHDTAAALGSEQKAPVANSAPPMVAQKEDAKTEHHDLRQIVNGEEPVVIFTAVETTVRYSDGVVSDYETDSAHELTITRLIFNVVPASSFSTQSAVGTVRGSWFTLQL
jgi:beta-lactamase regulating signal transducer with metallopeptidase domain